MQLTIDILTIVYEIGINDDKKKTITDMQVDVM